MEEKINIAEILKNKQKGIRLYSPIFGECAFCYVREDTNDICIKKRNGVIEYFNYEGLYFALGEVMLFPSKEMRVWDKFAWKKGDALSCGVDNLCIFEKWANEEYTEFYAKFVTPNYSGNTFKTEKWSKETNESVIKQYISNIDEFKGSKLNLTTLEIEKTQPEFKDGDIIVTAGAPYLYYSKCIIILKGDLYTKDNKAYSYAFYNINNKFIDFDIIDTRIRDREIRLATNSEKLQLFDMLTKEGKYWDAEKKQIVDLKPKWTPKPFDRVITRDDDDDVWIANIFSHMDSHGGYVPIGCVSGYHYCIPYNEETAKLIGTKNNVEY